MSEEGNIIPSTGYGEFLSALKKATVKEECDSSPASDGECLTNREITNGENLSVPTQSSSNLIRSCSPTPEISTEKSQSPNDGCSTMEPERHSSVAVYEIAWDPAMSSSDEEEEDIIDKGLYDKWYNETGQYDYYEVEKCFENYENSYEVDEVVVKLKQLAHSDKSSFEPGKILYKWSHGIEEDEDRNKIYDKWFSDLETWERQRLLWLDERGKIEGFDSSCDEDRTFLVKVDHDPEKLDSRTSRTSHENIFDLCQPYQIEDLSFAPSKKDALGVEEYLIADNPRPICETLNMDRNTNLVCPEERSEPLALPHDLTLVYEFTNHNLWRKYHNCFKEGKYTNK